MPYDQIRHDHDPVVRRSVLMVAIGAVLAVGVMYVLEKLF